jgi:hypothetical protein
MFQQASFDVISSLPVMCQKASDILARLPLMFQLPSSDVLASLPLMFQQVFL